MTLSVVATNGPAAASAGSLNVPWTNVPASGDVVVLDVLALAGQSIPASLAGWTTLFSNAAGGGYVGGQYWKVGTGSETGNQLVLTATTAAFARMTIYHSDVQTPAVTGTFGGDSNNAGDGITCTGAAVTTTAGDIVATSTVWALTNPSFPTVPVGATARNITQTGATFGTLVNSASTTWQTNHRYNLSHRPVTVGSSGAPLYVSNTTTVDLQGLTLFSVLTDTQPSGSTVTPPPTSVPITVPIPTITTTTVLIAPTPIIPIDAVAPVVTGTDAPTPPAPPDLCSATYDPILGRVRITAAMPTGTRADVERSIDGITWVPVRGGTGVVLTPGSTLTPPVTGQYLLPPVDDYEFPTGAGLPVGQYCAPSDPGIPVQYRVTPYTPPAGPDLISSCIDIVTPGEQQVWLKSIQRPFLNVPVTILRSWSDVTRENRGGVFPIVGRTLPVAVTDIRGSRGWTFGICVANANDATNVDLMLASGDPLYLQVPNNSNLPVPSMHVMIEDTAMKKVAWSDARAVTLPAIEVAAPGADVVGATSTWQTVLNTYPTWQAVLDANLTWIDLLSLVADASEVIVP